MAALFEKSSALLRFTTTTSKQPRPIRIMVIGQRGVGKTAMVVRFITRRFIGDYDSSTDKTYKHSQLIDNELMQFEIVDTPGVRNETTNDPNASTADADAELSALEHNIQLADAFILMYSVTDRCSFDDCSRLRFIINHNSGKQRRRSITSVSSPFTDTNSGGGGGCGGGGGGQHLDIPVILVGNKKDQHDDRMVDVAHGRQMYQEIACVGFHEISVRESADEVADVFRDVCRCWRICQRYPKLRRSTSDAHAISCYLLLSPEIPMDNAAAAAASGEQNNNNIAKDGGSATAATTPASSSAAGYFESWWSRSAEKRQSFFPFRSSNGSSQSCVGGGGSGGGHLSGSSSASSAQHSPSEDATAVDALMPIPTTAVVAATTTTNSSGRPKLTIRIPTPMQLQHQQQLQQHAVANQQQPFRERAATDGKILSRPRRYQYMTAGAALAATATAVTAVGTSPQPQPLPAKSTGRMERRMSISQRGSSGN